MLVTLVSVTAACGGGSSGKGGNRQADKCTNVTCTALDQCHEAGTCDAATGTCSNPAKADGVSCEDGNGCTVADTCLAGVCTEGEARPCADPDSCHLAGACSADTGRCSFTATSDGTACSNGVCRSGACAPSLPCEVDGFVRVSDAAHLVVQTARGDTVTLEMPPGTLARAQHVRLQALEAPLASPFRTSALLPGVVIEPDGLTLLRGALLQIDLIEPLRDPRATGIAWIKAPDSALLLANPSAGPTTVSSNLRHFSAYQPVDLGAAAAASELPPASPTPPQDYDGLLDAAIDAQSMAVLARGACGGQASCALGDADAHAAAAVSLMGGAIDILVGETNPSDACGSYLIDLYEALNVAASLVGSDSLAQEIRDRIRDLEAQCCAPNTCSPVCPSCPDQGHWTVQWNKSGSVSGEWSYTSSGTSVTYTRSMNDAGGGFAEVQYGTGYVSAFSITGFMSDQWREHDYHPPDPCEGSESLTTSFWKCTLDANGIASAEAQVSGHFRYLNPRVSYNIDPFPSYSAFECIYNSLFTEDGWYILSCDSGYTPIHQNNPTTSIAQYPPGLGATLYPTGTEGLLYSGTQTREDWCISYIGENVCSQLTYDIEAAWTDADSQAAPLPPSCRGVTCPPLAPGDQCHKPGTCNPATGTCGLPTVRTGETCGGDLCTYAGICSAEGDCLGAVTMDRCPPPSQCEESVNCDPATGACNHVAKADDTPCDDGDRCTVVDRCIAGKCAGTPSAPCQPLTCHATPTCDAATGACVYTPLPKGKPCSGKSVCEVCDGNGTCEPLSQATLDISCDELINRTLAKCMALGNSTWRVDTVQSSAGGSATWKVACAGTGLTTTNNATTNVCGSSGAGACKGSPVTILSAAADTQCAKARDTTQGQCEAICTACAGP